MSKNFTKVKTVSNSWLHIVDDNGGYHFISLEPELSMSILSFYAKTMEPVEGGSMPKQSNLHHGACRILLQAPCLHIDYQNNCQ